MFALKALSHDGIGGALAKAERYRLLHEPVQAESICRDILEIEPDNQAALICFVLAQTDQIPQDKRAFQKALTAAEKLQGAYDRAYYSGIAWERRARAVHHEGAMGTRHSVHEWMVKALGYFEEAEHLRPAGNDDALLRWNTCVRFLGQHPEVAPRTEEIPEAIVSE
jgi:tetratricopeptide (TPR) repeat protein